VPPYNGRVSFRIRAITLDLDDTLWPFAPIGERIERALDDWLRVHSPRTAQRFPIPAMRALRERIHAEHPGLAHDYGTLRRMTLEHALIESDGDPALAESAYEAFQAARNEVTYYPDSLAALQRIAARVPLAAVTNGNADLSRIGIAQHFRFTLCSREHGSGKPEAGIFMAACERLGHAPGDVLHVGDHDEIDVLGASRAGLRSCWLNRGDAQGERRAWPHAERRPDLEFDTLTALADWLDATEQSSPRSAAA
jgi:putative hydrolase of the HAD superfamily